MENQFFIEEKVVFNDPVKASEVLCNALKTRVGSTFVVLENVRVYGKESTTYAVYIFKEKGVTRKNWRENFKPTHQVHFDLARDETVAYAYHMDTRRCTEIAAKEFRDLPVDDLLDIILDSSTWTSRQQHAL